MPRRLVQRAVHALFHVGRSDQFGAARNPCLQATTAARDHPSLPGTAWGSAPAAGSLRASTGGIGGATLVVNDWPKLPATKAAQAIAARRPGRTILSLPWVAKDVDTVGCRNVQREPAQLLAVFKIAPSVWHDTWHRHASSRRGASCHTFQFIQLARAENAACTSRGGALCHSFQFIHLARAENAACASHDAERRATQGPSRTEGCPLVAAAG